ncbi:MAG TPA: hypothetical protein VFA04_27960 [Bryobacteraceae bacterium]|nr:hypothetical protein [Bryobacteraceae bacterium]
MSITQGFRYGSSAIRRQRLLATAALFTLALIIRTAGALFALQDPVLLCPWGFPHPEQLVFVEARIDQTERARFRFALRYWLPRELRLVAVWLLIGAAVWPLLNRFLMPQLFEVRATDPAFYGTIAAMLLVVALAAIACPALRAPRGDPAAVLRHD